MNPRVLIPLVILALAATAWPAQHKKKKGKKDQEQPTQILELPKDPPPAVVAEVDRLTFTVSPLTSQGLLSHQLREALKWVLRQDRPVVRLRAFVAGTGDTRRVQAVVSDVFTEKHLALPALSVVQIGALPLEGAQVVVEAAMTERKPVNPYGLAFVPVQQAYIAEPVQPVEPLARKVAAALRTSLQAAGMDAASVLRVGCYLTTLDDINPVRALLAAEFPRASLLLLQPLRGALTTGLACDAVARLAAPPRQPLEFVNPDGLEHTPESSAMALVGPHRIALSSTQLAFGRTEEDASLAFQRLGKSLEQVAGAYERTALVQIYSLSRGSGELARRAGARFFDKTRPPAVTVLPFEGLPSIDAFFAVDVVVMLPEHL
jgi:enamine deaminase RidA (YjgF/YER057c/UK114 family)